MSITLHTNFGDITLELFNDKAPVTAANFLQYCRDGHYNGTIFHRVIDGGPETKTDARRRGWSPKYACRPAEADVRPVKRRTILRNRSQRSWLTLERQTHVLHLQTGADGQLWRDLIPQHRIGVQRE